MHSPFRIHAPPTEQTSEEHQGRRTRLEQGQADTIIREKLRQFVSIGQMRCLNVALYQKPSYMSARPSMNTDIPS